MTPPDVFLHRQRYDAPRAPLDHQQATCRAIFDNSQQSALWLAEITDGTQLQYRTEEIPHWFFEAHVDEVEP